MKPTNKQLELIKFCKGILETWESTNDIVSPTHWNDLQEFINADLENYPQTVQDGIYDSLSDLLNVIRKYESNK
jgi:hypothetical protein